MNRLHAASLLVALGLSTLSSTAHAQDPGYAPAGGGAANLGVAATSDVGPSSIEPSDDTMPPAEPVVLVAPSEITPAAEPIEPVAPAAPAAPAPSGSAVTARYAVGDGLTIASEDGLFTLKFKGYMQLRFTVSDGVQDEVPASTELVVRRMRFTIGGQFVVPELTYAAQFVFANGDMESDLRVPLLDAWVNYSAARDFQLRVGQAKVPYGSLFSISSANQQFADASIVKSELGMEYDMGVYAYSKDLFGLGNRLQYQLGMFSGDGRNRTSTRSGLLWAARVEFTPFGKFETGAESDHARSSEPRLQLAFSAALNKNTVRSRSISGDTYTLGGFDYQHLDAELMFKVAGFSLEAEWLWRNATTDSHSRMNMDGTTSTESARSAWGYVAQAGYLLSCGFEVAARYGDVQPRAGSPASQHRAREVGGALNYYFEKHALKLQADYFYLYGEAFDDGHHQVRVQAQLQF